MFHNVTRLEISVVPVWSLRITIKKLGQNNYNFNRLVGKRRTGGHLEYLRLYIPAICRLKINAITSVILDIFDCNSLK